MACLLRALRDQQAEARAIGQEVLARRAAVAELAERIEREGFDAVVNPPEPAPVAATFTETAFAAWYAMLLRRGLIDADALLLAWCVWVWLPRLNQGDAALAFLEVLAGIDPQQYAAADSADLRALLDQPALHRGRGRPKGRDRRAAAVDDANGRELFAKRQSEGQLTISSFDPWHVVQHLADVIDQTIADDRGVTNTTHLQGNSALKQAWLGSKRRRLPSLRRRFVIEALAKGCLTWWLDDYRREAAAASC